MSACGLALFDLPVAPLKVLDNRISHTFVLRWGGARRSASPVNQ
jgi:hypothetical protein